MYARAYDCQDTTETHDHDQHSTGHGTQPERTTRKGRNTGKHKNKIWDYWGDLNAKNEKKVKEKF